MHIYAYISLRLVSIASFGSSVLYILFSSYIYIYVNSTGVSILRAPCAFSLCRIRCYITAGEFRIRIYTDRSLPTPTKYTCRMKRGWRLVRGGILTVGVARERLYLVLGNRRISKGVGHPLHTNSVFYHTNVGLCACVGLGTPISPLGQSSLFLYTSRTLLYPAKPSASLND